MVYRIGGNGDVSLTLLSPTLLQTTIYRNSLLFDSLTTDDITHKELWRGKGVSVLKQAGNIQQILQHYFPKDQVILGNHNFKRQYSMTRILKQLFPKDLIYDSFYIEDLRFATGKTPQLDAYFPNLMIAFEYQGEQHYGHTAFQRDNLKTVQRRDEEKAQKCRKYGITLVAVPYWWNGSKDQLAASIQQVRPDLIPYEVTASPFPSDNEYTPKGTLR
jgi:hypothetical protein